MKFAIIEIGGKQYRVSEGATITTEKADVEANTTMTIKTVLAVENGSTLSVGTPFVTGASVTAEVISVYRAAKVLIIKKIPKKRYERKRGHRQHQMKLRITQINA